MPLTFARAPAVAAAAAALTLAACWKSPPSAERASAPASSSGASSAPASSGASSSGASRATGSVSGRELAKRARAAADAALADLGALEAKPSSAAFGRACGKLGELEGYLVSLSYLLNDGLVAFVPPDAAAAAPARAPAAATHADPRQWVSTADALAPLCARRGSSADDFVDDLATARANVGVVKSALAAFR